MATLLLGLMLVADPPPAVRVLTSDAGGHVLANRNCWTPDGRWIAYDTRVDETVFDAKQLRRVNALTGDDELIVDRILPVGVPTYGPDETLVFLQAMPDPYSAWRRFGAVRKPQHFVGVLDARDTSPPFTPAALRGGTHLHTVSPDGRRVASTYEDEILAESADPTAAKNLRTVAVTELRRRVDVPFRGFMDFAGHFTCVVAGVTDDPRPGSDDISRAFSDAWLGPGSDRIAFLGRVRGGDGTDFDELFVADLPRTLADPDPGTPTTRPQPPAGVSQRRVTRTAGETHPGVAGPRFWPVGDPDGSRVAVYRTDDAGRAQLCVVDIETGMWSFVTSGDFAPQSAFTWSPVAPLIALVADGSVFVVNADTGIETRLTEKTDPGPRHHACVFSPDGTRIAFMQPVTSDAGTFDQIAVVDLPAALTESTE